MKRMFCAMAAAMMLAGIFAGCVFQQGSEIAVYKDPSKTVEERVNDLMSRMNLSEKIGQMMQPDLGIIQGNENEIARLNLGSVLSGGSSDPSTGNDPQSWANVYYKCQKVAVENTRLGIPILYGVDAVHGHSNLIGTVIFPHNIGIGATMDPAVAEECASVTAEEVTATGIDWTFAPCVDVGRDERWGRTYETFGEDPLLCGVLGAAAVEGFQGDAEQQKNMKANGKILACAKHFLGSGGTTNGEDQGDAQVSMKEIRETYLPPFKMTVDAGVWTIMPSYCSVNGLKMHANVELLTDILKGELGFGNLLISDYDATKQIDDPTGQNFDAATYKNGVLKSINAGLDMIMMSGNADQFKTALTELVNEGSVPMQRIDDAVRRIITTKFSIGLFENPYGDQSKLSTIGSAEHREVARQAVRESTVLLENKGILPLLKSVSKILVAGPNANNITNQCGGWTIDWQGAAGTVYIDGISTEVPPGTTILDGIKNAVSPSTQVDFVERDPVSAAISASSADVAIVVVGETAYAEHAGDTIETGYNTNNRADQMAFEMEEFARTIYLTADQQALIDSVVSTGTPTIVVMVAGRPLLLDSPLIDMSTWAAFLMAWLPGTEGQGVADVLFGDYNPSAKLPVTWAKSLDQIPINYDDAVAANYDPLYPFGYGLSYTKFEYKNLSASVSQSDKVNVSIEVKNAGHYSGNETVQVFIKKKGEAAAPFGKLRAFGRVELKPGEAKTMHFSVTLEDIAEYTGTSERLLEPGIYEVHVGSLFGTFEVETRTSG
ncbi:MAG: glycoside hydrolase family 3 N-terminal domain-containing protein [Candidatus Thermoplasmatota archaeon]|nr:glycoside hydrolase family 3 N-terminal domain-containing protein [Candidatus Thermoplasmatota archaeon]